MNLQSGAVQFPMVLGATLDLILVSRGIRNAPSEPPGRFGAGSIRLNHNHSHLGRVRMGHRPIGIIMRIVMKIASGLL